MMGQDAYIERHAIENSKSVYYFAAHAGSHISNAISSALGQLVYKTKLHGHGNTCGFLKFNDLSVPLIGGDTVEQACARYQEMSDKRRAEWVASPEYAAREAESARRAVDKQRQLDETVNKIEGLCAQWLTDVGSLPNDWATNPKSVVQPHGPLAADLFQQFLIYIDGADLVGITNHADRVRTAMESVGYKENEYLGHDFELLNAIEHQQIYRAFYAGQMLNMMGSIHPGLACPMEKHELHLQHP